MPLKDDIEAIRDALRKGSFPNEAAVSQGIVTRLLQTLNWPIFDAQIVFPEYTSGKGRVDYALCHPKRKPIVFIEVKQVGHGVGADRQLFEYAFHEGVPLAILTDGQEWHFYLPAEQGRFEERRVYKLDLLERDVDECVRVFSRYLRYSDVCSGQALENARSDYKNLAKGKEIKRALPAAWQRILGEPDSLLVELLAEEVESVCGYRPDLETISEFLAQQAPKNVEPPLTPAYETKKHQTPTAKEIVIAPQRGKPRFVLFGKEYPCSSANDVVAQLLTKLATRDPTFFERFAARPHGRKRR